MKEKLRMILAVTGIFLLLPLLLTVFLSGREALHIKKQWNMESLLPMLMCREIPWEYEEEMKKVQAVLTRSSLYLRIEEEKMDGEAWGNLWKEAKAAQHQKSFLYRFFCGALAGLWWKICVFGRKQRYIKNWRRKIR